MGRSALPFFRLIVTGLESSTKLESAPLPGSSLRVIASIVGRLCRAGAKDEAVTRPAMGDSGHAYVLHDHAYVPRGHEYVPRGHGYVPRDHGYMIHGHGYVIHGHVLRDPR